MERIFKVCAFVDQEVGYVAVAAAAPGLSGTGRTPDQAASNLLWQFLASFDDMPRSPTPDSELVAVVDVQMSLATFSET
jgi:hypothetical protein